jgi:cellulose biosynthesis protein BcsQ
MTGTSIVMKGLLSEFNLADVLQVVSLSRQFTAIELKKLDGRPNGVIWIKSGHVIAAQQGSVEGRPAFYELFHSMADMFVVFRLDDPPSFNPPIGRLPDLLLEAADPSRRIEGSAAAPPPADPKPPRAVRASAPTPIRPAMPAPVAARPATPAPVAARPATLVSESRRTAPASSPVPMPRAAGSGIVVAVCSPKGGVGKTTIALNLAVSLAQREVRTILVDADINGDQLGMLDARDRVSTGVYDILDRPEAVDEVLRGTASPHLRLLPASGPELSEAVLAGRDQSAGWRRVLQAVGARADITLVDCPAGMFGVTQEVLGAVTHVIGVFQSEMVARRSFAMFSRGLQAVPADRRPTLLGVVVNMFQRRSGPSVEAFQTFCDEADRHRLFETTIPRSEAFAEASLAGKPLRFTEGASPSPVAWLFDMLADEVFNRSGMRTGAAASPRSFLT